MVKLQVDFHNMLGSELVLASAQGKTFQIGETVTIYNEDTPTYDGIIIEQDKDTLVIQIVNKNPSKIIHDYFKIKNHTNPTQQTS